jgi:hypothetical protein
MPHKVLVCLVTHARHLAHERDSREWCRTRQRVVAVPGGRDADVRMTDGRSEDSDGE